MNVGVAVHRPREPVLEAVTFAAHRFLNSDDWDCDIRAVLERLGLATGVSRVYIFENIETIGDDVITDYRYEWTAPGISPQIGNPRLKCVGLRASGYTRWLESLGSGALIHGRVSDFPPAERPVLEGQQILSLLEVPIFAGDRWWGFIGFDECLRERMWSPAEQDALIAAAGIIGGALRRRSIEEALRQAQADLEDRVKERTAELAAVNAALRNSEQRFRALIENSTDAISIMDAQGRSIYLSPSVTRELGYDHVELLGTPIFDYLHPEDIPKVRQALRRLLVHPDAVVAVQARLRHKNGSWRHMESLCHNLLGTPGVEGIVVNARDWTERRRLEQRLLQAERLEAVGRLAGGVAHDFNNLLTVISGYAEMLRESLPGGDLHRSEVEQILGAVGRATSLTNQLLAFSRRRQVQPRVFDLNQLVGGLESMLRRLIAEHIELRFELDPSLRAIKADPTSFEQVIVNLAVNARDAMPEGGVLTIRTANSESEVEEESATRTPCVLLSVQDTGTGMTPETMAHLFEPFFSTKAPGKGTGLGLSSVYGIVKQAGGEITVVSEVGAGSVFTVSLPAASEVPAAGDSHVDSATAGGSERILLVEDEPGVRSMVRAVLEHHGYRVTEASDGAEALQASEERSFDLVLTDLIMPAFGGRELAERLRWRHPNLKVLFMSGYTDAQDGVTEPAALLQKPFSYYELLRRVRAVLDAR